MTTDDLTAVAIARLRQAEIQLRHLPLDEFPESRHQLADWIADGCNSCEQMAQEIQMLQQIATITDKGYKKALAEAEIRYDQLAQENVRLKANSYPHMCRDDHEQIGHSDSEQELCPFCKAQAKAARYKAAMEQLASHISLDALVEEK